MTFVKKVSKRRALICVLALLVCGDRASAQSERMEDKLAIKHAESGKRHVERREGTIVDNWKIKTWYKDARGKHEIDLGDANLTLNPDGSWNFSGQMNRETVGACGQFYLVMAAKSSEGTSVGFKQSALLEVSDPAAYGWERQGRNQTIKDNYPAFEKAHDWAGSWTCVPPPQPQSGGGGSDVNWGSIISGVGQALGTVLSFFL